jgi:hypothetical protein
MRQVLLIYIFLELAQIRLFSISMTQQLTALFMTQETASIKGIKDHEKFLLFPISSHGTFAHVGAGRQCAAPIRL